MQIKKKQFPVAGPAKAFVSGRRLLGLRVRIMPGVWISVCCECYVWSVRGRCDGSISRLEASYRVCVCVSLSVVKGNIALYKYSK